ncbi:MAG: hypothetical protein ABF461_06270 [Zymomonas mobilis subsp. pomaceae]|uniref:NTF2 domain-containing protein n=1 Tax=Zymomonas mobilis subsp. pomaceae (strain ATCC 29192 / DSM 22645 / JCM 10191 / CCUG 17912 / NBRC 13757 / NCIMB 11200 / NRRL B-4491 / Barker I) TaxID=579138 RepID=F8ES55_ZYMMT|nr:hypothetical protein [Zymomonas mobilis]AEI37630.1 hypothetical protein Zymop_0728 [Zymomonas mobilis subsp. pomaceae ATCC 29192]MDX5948998.1 hypothetical protein [Zymomonas mobilis subsp. pomaceae]GEB88803.1 hypothetical protein ZMO02_04400 [Zymomonas mobilis subsp. pomaceae]
MNDHFGSEAESRCSAGANDYLRSVAVNDFAWDDDTKGFLGVRFDKINRQSEAPYVITLISTRAKLSNTFGAFRHIELYCSYHVLQKKVLSYSLTNPLLLKAELNNFESPQNSSRSIEFKSQDEQSTKDETPATEGTNTEQPAPDDLKTRAEAFISEYYNVAAQNPEQAIPWMIDHYTQTVDFFGKSLSKKTILDQKRDYLTRWPDRSYKLVPGTATNTCDRTNMICRSTGTLQFEVRSPSRGALSRGLASFVLTIDFSNSVPLIMSENSRVLSRE